MAPENSEEVKPPGRDKPAVAKERKVNQIAMGTRGMGALGSVFMGSVAQRVVHQSPVPVLLAK